MLLLGKCKKEKNVLEVSRQEEKRKKGTCAGGRDLQEKRKHKFSELSDSQP